MPAGEACESTLMFEMLEASGSQAWSKLRTSRLPSEKGPGYENTGRLIRRRRKRLKKHTISNTGRGLDI